jgi:hypothetical protein
VSELSVSWAPVSYAGWKMGSRTMPARRWLAPGRRSEAAPIAIAPGAFGWDRRVRGLEAEEQAGGHWKDLGRVAAVLEYAAEN